MEKVYSAKEIATKFDVSVETVWRWFRKGNLAYIKIGGKKMVTEKEFKRFLEKGNNNER